MNTMKMKLPVAIVVALGLAACGAERGGDEYEQQDMADQRDAVADNSGAEMASEHEVLEHTSADLPQTLHEGEQDTLDTLLRAIRQEVGNPSASQRDQCRVVGIGHRPCGGPERYLLYSTQTTDESQLLPMVERYNALVRQRVDEEGMVGTCEVLPEPGVIVNNGVCTAAERATR